MREIKFIELVLENCEVIKILPRYIGAFNINNIHRSISRATTNAILETASCDLLYLQISSKFTDSTSMWLEKGISPIDRLTKCRDLVGVVVNYVDGTDEMVYVPWDDDPSEYTNSYETSRVNPHTGDLFIVVSKTQHVGNVFKEQLTSKISDCDNVSTLSTQDSSCAADEHLVNGESSLAAARVLACLRDGMTQGEICREYNMTSQQLETMLEYAVNVLEYPFVKGD